MTKQQLLEAAKLKNFKTESHVNRFGNELIGINKNKHCWHWFEILETGYALFSHTYSMNTGKSKSGTLHALNVCTSLQGK